MMPNMESIGGLTLKRTADELPMNIASFIGEAQRGTILMTFGTMASTLPVTVVEKFVSTFRRLEGYRVIWRLNNKDSVELPENVTIAGRLPQQDILAQLFITHCGNNGQFEAVYNGVPMIGFPMFGEQLHNARRLDHKGYGLSMDLYHFTADELLANIRKVMEDTSYNYKERVANASEIFRSQPQSPVETATFWIEHVCRFGGDLRSAGNDFPLYSYLMLDVLAFILITLFSIFYLLFKLVKFLFSECRGQRKQPVEVIKSKKIK